MTFEEYYNQTFEYREEGKNDSTLFDLDDLTQVWDFQQKRIDELLLKMEEKWWDGIPKEVLDERNARIAELEKEIRVLKENQRVEIKSRDASASPRFPVFVPFERVEFIEEVEDTHKCYQVDSQYYTVPITGAYCMEGIYGPVACLAGDRLEYEDGFLKMNGKKTPFRIKKFPSWIKKD
jgi:hypothetical protein